MENETSNNTVAKRANRLLSAAQRRARRKGIQLTIKVEDIAPALNRGVCAATGIPFVMDIGKGSSPYSPTIDRIDPNVGYIPTNIRVVVFIYNVCRNEWGDEVVIDFAKRLLQISTGPMQSSQNPTKLHSLDPKISFRA